jgi:hypothetical protein
MRSRTRGESFRRCALVAAALLLCGACVNQGGKTIDWDLSSSHTSEDVGWPEDRDAATQVAFEDVESVNLTFPGGLTLEADDEVLRVWAERVGDEIVLVQVDFEIQTPEDALERAKDLAEEWDVDTEPLDEWFDQIPELDAGAEVSHNALALGEETAGVKPQIEILYSFNDERPSVVTAVMNWVDG